MKKCECPELGATPMGLESWYSEEEKSGMNHAPNKCKGTNRILQYDRGNKKLYLCSCCHLFGDKLLDTKGGDTK